MPLRGVLFAFVFLPGALTSQNRTAPEKPPDSSIPQARLASCRPGAWTLTITTAGGYFGAESGEHATLSGTQGYASISERAKAQSGLRVEWLTKVEDAVRAAKPVLWGVTQGEPDYGCCDRPGITLHLAICQADGWRDYSAAWLLGSPIPQDLRLIYSAATLDDPGGRRH